MKKRIGLFLALVMILALAVPASAEGMPTFVISEATAAPGEEVSVTVSMQNNPGICGVMLCVDYNHDVLTLTDVRRGTYTTGSWLAMEPNGDAFWVAGHNETHDGLFATLIFTVAASAAAGDYEVSVHYDEDDVFNDDYDNVRFDITPGKVTVTGNGSSAKLHTVTVVTDGSGTASVAPTAPEQSATVTLTVTPNNGCHFDRVEFYQKSGAGVDPGALHWNDAGKTFTMPDYDVVIKVFFEGHTFGEWIQTTAPTVTAAGEETRTCRRCGATETRRIAAIVLGDANCDGKVTSSDASAVLRSIVGMNTLSDEGLRNANVDGEDGVTAIDAAMILRLC